MNNKFKNTLCVIADSLDNQHAGVHRVTYELLNELHSRDDLPFKVIVIREKASEEFSKFKQIAIPSYNKIPGFMTLKYFTIIPFYCMIHKADYVLEMTHFGPFNLWPSIKRLTFIHDLTTILYPQFHIFNGRFLQKLFLPGIVKRSSLLITNSKNTKSDLEHLYPNAKNKTQFIHLGISKFFHPFIDNDLLKAQGIDKPFFLMVGTIEPRKNIITVLKAYKTYKERNGNDEILVLAGSKGWKSDDILAAIHNHKFSNDIRLLGRVSNETIRTLYSACYKFIYASHYEGFGFPVLEAALCNARLIVANNSSLKEIAPEGTRFFESNDIHQLSEHMASSWEPSYNDSEIRGHYNWQSFTGKLIDLVKSIK